MDSLADRMKKANQLLSPHAVPIQGTLGRVVEEERDETRFPFQRDRDRIIHSRAFRRLKGKTQVFVADEGDHYRTRLTHTIEVAQISRDIARTLDLNEDLCECIALAHDLGHPPFGHAGEEALDVWMKGHGSSFEHNNQSLRIITVLEHHSSQFLGLNLNQEVLEGLIKHRTPHDHPDDTIAHQPTLEAEVVNIADEIAYTGHDCDDGLRAGLFTYDQLLIIPLIKKAHEISTARGTPLRGAIVHLLVHDLYASFDQSISFSSSLRIELDQLREFLWKNMYLSPEVKKHTEKGKEIVRSLCDHLYDHPTEKIEELMKKTNSNKVEAIKDFVSGMTDEYAMTSNSQLITHNS